MEAMLALAIGARWSAEPAVAGDGGQRSAELLSLVGGTGRWPSALLSVVDDSLSLSECERLGAFGTVCDVLQLWRRRALGCASSEGGEKPDRIVVSSCGGGGG